MQQQNALQLLLAESGLTARFVKPYEVIVDVEEMSPHRVMTSPSLPLLPRARKSPRSKSRVNGLKPSPSKRPPTASSPSRLIDGQEIERFGRNLESAIAPCGPSIVPHVSGGQPNTVDVGQNPLNLRGLGTDETLFLVDGSPDRCALDRWHARPGRRAPRRFPRSDVDRAEIYSAPASSRIWRWCHGRRCEHHPETRLHKRTIRRFVWRQLQGGHIQPEACSCPVA